MRKYKDSVIDDFVERYAGLMSCTFCIARRSCPWLEAVSHSDEECAKTIKDELEKLSAT